MAGLSGAGLEIRTQPEIQALLEERLDAALPGVNLRAGPLQQLVGILSEELAVAWEALQAVYASSYPESASGFLLDLVASITGTFRRQATRSRVTGTVNLNAGVTLPAGSIAAVADEPDYQFRTVAAVTNSSGGAANVEVELEALDTGPIPAPSGQLTVIVTPVPGWNTITNAAVAELGELVATDEELRTTRLVQLAGSGSGTIASVRANVSRVNGVQEVFVFENVQLTTVDGRPGKSFEVVIWDGATPAADDAQVAQAIWDKKADGAQAFGVGSSGTAVDDTGAEQTVAFTRASALRVYVDAQVVLAPGTGAGWEALAKAAIEARALEYTVGETAYSSQLVCALLDVPGVVAVLDLDLGLAPSPTGSSVVAAYDEIIRIAAADVTVGT